MKCLHPTGRSAGAPPGRWLVATDRGLGPTLRRCRRTARRLRVAGEDASAALRLRPRLSSEARRQTSRLESLEADAARQRAQGEQRAQRNRQQVARSRQARTTNAKQAAEQRDAASRQATQRSEQTINERTPQQHPHTVEAQAEALHTRQQPLALGIRPPGRATQRSARRLRPSRTNRATGSRGSSLRQRSHNPARPLPPHRELSLVARGVGKRAGEMPGFQGIRFARPGIEGVGKSATLPVSRRPHADKPRSGQHPDAGTVYPRPTP
jgi:flagellar biosynthesis GTPase FlhF